MRGWLRRRRTEADVIDVEEERTVLGSPGACPACGGPGYLDKIDLVHGQQHQHCKRCDHRWEIAVAPADPDFVDAWGRRHRE